MLRRISAEGFCSFCERIHQPAMEYHRGAAAGILTAIRRSRGGEERLARIAVAEIHLNELRPYGPALRGKSLDVLQGEFLERRADIIDCEIRKATRYARARTAGCGTAAATLEGYEDAICRLQELREGRG